MFMQDIENKEPIIKEFFIWLFDDDKILCKNVDLQSEIDLSLAPFYSDPNIYYPSQIANFFETKAMKRLGRISQLSFTINFYPNTYHNRLEHSKEAYNRKLEELLNYYNNPEWKKYVENNNLKIYLLADLIKMAGHDIGHFPLSHAFEENIFGEYGLHEIIGKKIMLEDKEIQKLFNNISPFLGNAIKELFEKNVLNLSLHDEGNFDVDRLDYLSRDSLYIGIPFNSKTLPYKKVAVKTDSSGKPILKDDFSLSPEINGQDFIDVYDYNSLKYIETFLKTRFNNYKTIYMSTRTKIAENAIKAFMDIFLFTKPNIGLDLYNYIKYLQNININNIDIDEFLKWDEIYFYAQIIEIAKNHSNENVRNLATMILPNLKPFLSVIYNHLNVHNSINYSDKDVLFLKTIKKIINGDDEFSKNIKNPNFLYDNTFIVNDIANLPNGLDKSFVHDFTYRLVGYNKKSPIYIRSSNGNIYELSRHPERTMDWNNLCEDLNSKYVYIPYLKFFNFKDSQILDFSKTLGIASSKYHLDTSAKSSKKTIINMRPLQVGNDIEDCFLEL